MGRFGNFPNSWESHRSWVSLGISQRLGRFENLTQKLGKFGKFLEIREIWEFHREIQLHFWGISRAIVRTKIVIKIACQSSSTVDRFIERQSPMVDSIYAIIGVVYYRKDGEEELFSL